MAESDIISGTVYVEDLFGGVYNVTTRGMLHSALLISTIGVFDTYRHDCPLQIGLRSKNRDALKLHYWKTAHGNMRSIITPTTSAPSRFSPRYEVPRSTGGPISGSACLPVPSDPVCASVMVDSG